MDIKKKAEFVAKMRRQKFAKGGPVRQYLDLGGPASTTSGGNTQASGPMSPGGTLQNVGSGLGIDPDSGVGKAFDVVGSLNPLDTQDHFKAIGAPLQEGTNASQLNTAYNQTQTGLGMQQDFANQLAGQNGIGHQNDVYNQYQGIVNGTGPNPAMAALHQQTAQNVANQNAMAAGQRGAASNVGLMARNAAQQGAATQQQAVGQGATMQANQSLNALGQMSNIAGNQVNQQGQAITGYNTAAQNEQNTLQTANSNYNNAKVGMQSNVNNVNGQISQGNQAANNGMMQGMMSGGGGMSMLSGMLAKGGVVGHDGKKLVGLLHTAKGVRHFYDDGGVIDDTASRAVPAATPAPSPTPEGGDAPQANLGQTSYTSASGSSAPNIGSMAATDESAPFKQNSGGGGGGGGGGLGMLALLADGGEVNLGSTGYTQATATGAPNIGSMSATDESAAFKQAPKDNKKKKPTQPAGDDNADHHESNAVLMQSDQDASAMPASTGTMYAATGGHVCTQACGPHKSHVANYLSKGGKTGAKVPAMLSPKEVYLSPQQVRQVIDGGANPMKIGTHIKGKAKVKNDSLKNDTIPATLEEGGVVIPRHITTHKMSAEKAELFVHRAMAKRGMK